MSQMMFLCHCMCLLRSQMAKKWQKVTGKGQKNSGFDTNHVYSALTILDSFRTYRFRK